MPKPLRTVSTMVSKKHQLPATSPGPSAKKGFCRGKDAVMPFSLTTCCIGGSARSRSVVEGARSGRSWWPELGSGRKSMWVPSSGPLHMDVAAEPDLLEPDMEQANNVQSRQDQVLFHSASPSIQTAKSCLREFFCLSFATLMVIFVAIILKDARIKVDEDDFSFDNPMAAAFVFQEDMCQRRADARGPAEIHSSHNSVISTPNTDDLQLSNNHHHSEDVSSSGGKVSYICLDGEEQIVVLDVLDSIGLSSRVVSSFTPGALSRCLLGMGKSERFSVDLQRGLIIDRSQRPRTSDVRLEIKSENSLSCSILAPCLVRYMYLCSSSVQPDPIGICRSFWHNIDNGNI